MKLYSSTFLSLVLALFVFMGSKGYPIVVTEDANDYSFSGIVEPLPKIPSEDIAPEKVTIEIFETFGCKECMDFAFDTLGVLQEKYKEDERVDVQVYSVPDGDDESQNIATIGTLCAGEQEKYNEMYYALHGATEPLDTREIDLIGQEMELEILPFRNCLKSDRYGAKIGEDIAYAEERGITKKPTILIGDYILRGNHPVENIEKVVNNILKK